ncbi:hypothetical protein [Schlesneria paludicola]|uniref:hypothetical protein n=1 Tax=Schlesneria paludicola TaxID=360056 RepID=UPI00029A5EDF|nr:hypothetical protein [Schlesneria paludicola]
MHCAPSHVATVCKAPLAEFRAKRSESRPPDKLNVPQLSPKRTGRQRRIDRRTELMNQVPFCCECGRYLVNHSGRFNSANLVRGRLACPEHVSQVRDSAKLAVSAGDVPTIDNIAEERVFITPKGYRHLARWKEEQQRSKLKAQLMAQLPICDYCGCELVESPHTQHSAHLVQGRLSCLEHVKIVRACAFAESDLSIIVKAS